MPKSNYLKVTIGGNQMDLDSTQAAGFSISYQLEDSDDFQQKKSSEAFNVEFPATLNNQKATNDITNPSVQDMTNGEVFKGFHPVTVEANGYELLVGKARYTGGTHTSRPLSYKADFYGMNGDWMIDLKEITLHDLLKHINFLFSKQNIIDSWQYDGSNESLPYVFAPVRYLGAMATMNDISDYNMKPEYMKPAVSKYWLIYWAFKSLGYRVQSSFFDSYFFRRQVMPWTWGNFLYSEGTRLNNLDFKAKSTESQYISGDTTIFWDLKVSNDSTNGAFDNNGVYTYDAGNQEMKWTYPFTFDYGLLEATFHLAINVDATVSANSDCELRVQYFKNGERVISHDDNGNGTYLVNLSAPTVGRRDYAGIVDDRLTILVNPGDIISAKFYLHTSASSTGRANIRAEVMDFEIENFRIPLNGTIDFENFTSLKKYKFLDFLRGVVDEFNISIQTDSIRKIVLMEPAFPYSLGHDQSVTQPGYFNNDFIDWSGKQDLREKSEVEIFADYEREVVFRYKDDTADGILKVVQDRNQNVLAAAKYVFPDRFKAGNKDVPNRFFSPTMHYEVNQWRGLGSDSEASPQMICMIPENIANTSKQEAQNTFAPKSCYYKGIVNHVGWVFDGVVMNSFPFMFSVNYQSGGHNDPILSYSDERIGKFPDAILGVGLLRRFYLQRLAIMRNGEYYTTQFRLNNLDVTNWFHREYIICRGQRWMLIGIKNYHPLLEESTQCELRKWVPVTQEDGKAVYPSSDNVLEINTVTNTFDTRYAPLKCLPSDISKNS